MAGAIGVFESAKHIRRIAAICELLLEELAQSSTVDLVKLSAILEETGNSFLGLAEDVRQEMVDKFDAPAHASVQLRLIVGGVPSINDLRS